jgi:hypothetical protein
VQIQFDDIAGGECLLWEIGEEECVDDARTRDTDRFLLLFLPSLVSRMGRHHNPVGHALGSHRNLWTVVEAAHGLTFWTLLELIGRQVQPRLNQWVIQHAVLFATGHKRETSEVSDHGSQAILAVKPEQGTCL